MKPLKTIYSYILTVIILFLSSSGKAQDESQEPLSKAEAIQLTLENNYGIEVANNNLEIAENNASLLNSGYLPAVYALAGMNYQIQDSETDRDDGNSFELNNAESDNYSASVNLDYTLFDGLGRYYNYQRLKEARNLSQLDARQTIENTILQLFSVYYEVARLTENVEILEETLRISKDRVLRANYQFDYGQNTKLEVLNAEVDVTNDSINLMNNRQQLLNTKRDLNVVMARNLGTDFVVDTLVAFTPGIKLKTYTESALDNNIRILQSESNIQLSEYDIKTTRADYLPTVGLTGSYGWNKNNSPASAFFTGSTQKSTALGAGLNLTWNLFDGGATTVRYRNAKIARDNQELLKEQIRLEVERDIENARGDYDNLLQVYEIQEQNVITNQNNFERSRERFNIGLITSIEFRQAQINLLNAETNKNLAKYEAKYAELQLLQLIGQLLNVDF